MAIAVGDWFVRWRDTARSSTAYDMYSTNMGGS